MVVPENAVIAPSVWAAALDDPRRGLVILDEAMRAVHLSGQACALLGVTGDATGKDLQQLLSLAGVERPSAAAALEYVTRPGASCTNGPVELRIPGREAGLRMTARSVEPGYSVATFEAERSAAGPETTLRETDPLTGLANRKSFQEALEKVCSGAGTPAVLALDLDRFKAVNDSLGHPAGDALLQRVAERMLSVVRSSDVAGRLGGDEFAILLTPPVSEGDIHVIAKRLLDVIQRTYLLDGQLVNVGVSIGIALAPEHGNTPTTLLKNADLALYHSKTSGRASFHFFDATMEQKAQEFRRNELELRRALALRQFAIHYQPQVAVDTGRITGFEALVRWHHPERGTISPADFLPLAEQIGLIVPLGDWVLRTACKEAARWSGDITVAVNASPLQFVTGQFAETVRSVLRATGLPGERLEIEITEGILLRNEEAVTATLHALRDMKVRIAMDDFGTGYASLSQLALFPFSKIKIDKSLMGGDQQNTKHRAIVRAITTLGDSLGMSTIAEGIETAEQVSRLQSDGCSSVQGYFYSKPVPASEIQDLISKRNER